MTYVEAENIVVAELKKVVNADKSQKFKKCKRYEGEFKGSIDLPEDYKPREQIYALVSIMNGGKGANEITRTGSLVVFIGCYGEMAGRNDSTVKDLLHEAESALNKKRFMLNESFVQLFWQSDAQEFSVPDHVCFSQTYTYQMTR